MCDAEPQRSQSQTIQYTVVKSFRYISSTLPFSYIDTQMIFISLDERKLHWPKAQNSKLNNNKNQNKTKITGNDSLGCALVCICEILVIRWRL